MRCGIPAPPPHARDTPLETDHPIVPESTNLLQLAGALAWRGFRQLLAIALFVAAFGALAGGVAGTRWEDPDRGR